MPRTSNHVQSPAGVTPYFELRVGGLRITADRLPVRLVAATSSAATGLVTWWLTR